MKKIASILIILFVLTGFTPPSRNINNVIPSCVYIKAFDGVSIYNGGSGFAISGNKIITCYHIVKTYKDIEIYDNNGVKHEVLSRVLKPLEDIAILTITGYIPPVTICKNYTTGDSIYTVSTPKKKMLMNSTTTGIIGKDRRIFDGMELMQLNTSIVEGCSGGLVVNSNFEAIGMIKGYIVEVPNIGIAIPLKNIKGGL